MDGGDCEDCVKVVRSTKKVRVPCHRNEYKQYTVKVPRQVDTQVPETVKYTDYEMRCKQVPYQATEKVTKYRDEQRPYKVPVTKQVTKMVDCVKKVPKTIYVDVTTKVPKKVCVTEMETKYRTVKIPYTVDKCVTKYKSQPVKVPVCKTKTVMKCVKKTVFDTEVRTKCVPKVTYVTKEVPVFTVVAKPAQPCPPEKPEEPCAPCGTGGDPGYGNPGMPGDGNGSVGIPGFERYQKEFNSLDKNNDGRLDIQEYAAARKGPGGGDGIAHPQVSDGYTGNQ